MKIILDDGTTLTFSMEQPMYDHEAKRWLTEPKPEIHLPGNVHFLVTKMIETLQGSSAVVRGKEPLEAAPFEAVVAALGALRHG